MQTIKVRRVARNAAIASAVYLAAVSSHAADVVFNAIPDPLPPNVPSQPFQAQQVREFGDKITLAPGGARNLQSVDLMLSSWACQSGSGTTCVTNEGATFDHPITLTIYNADTMAVLGTTTQTFSIPYRPSYNPACASGTGWMAANGSCYNGFANVVTFDAPELAALVLPETFVFGITYNTGNYGYAPIGATGPYDSLNVGLPPTNEFPVPYVGVDATGDDGAYWYTETDSWYCDDGVAGNSFRLDDGCWAPYGTIAIKFVTAPPLVDVNVTGFDYPVDNAPVMNIAKAGQAIPLKFYVATPAGVPITDLTSVNVTMATVSCSSLDPEGTDAIEQVATGGSGLINKGGGYYQFNWKTAKGTTGCQVATLGLPSAYDASPAKLEAYFKFTK